MALDIYSLDVVVFVGAILTSVLAVIADVAPVTLALFTIACEKPLAPNNVLATNKFDVLIADNTLAPIPLGCVIVPSGDI